MGKNTQIEWATHTFNPWRGCTKVSDGCKFCYAEKLSHRNPVTLGVWGDNGTRVVASESMWCQPLKWNKAASEVGERHRVFCASLADVFEDRTELADPRARLFNLIQRTPNLDWLLLTKRPENVIPCLSRIRDDVEGVERSAVSLLPLPNVWFGTSVENQDAANQRIPWLLEIPAVVRFLSVEPLLGPTEFCVGPLRDGSRATPWYDEAIPPGIHWVIVGGESGPRSRPMHPDWVRSIRDQCQAAGVPFFFKQWGEWAPSSGQAGKLATSFDMPRIDLDVDGRNLNGKADWGTGRWCAMVRYGKKAADRILDGRWWNEFPACSSSSPGKPMTGEPE